MLDVFSAKGRAATEANAGLNEICSGQRVIATNLGSVCIRSMNSPTSRTQEPLGSIKFRRRSTSCASFQHVSVIHMLMNGDKKEKSTCMSVPHFLDCGSIRSAL